MDVGSREGARYQSNKKLKSIRYKQNNLLQGDIDMKKKVIAIVVMVALVMSIVACSSTQAQPVQESTPAPKTETAAKSVEETKVETPAVTEEPKVEEPEVKEEPVAEPVTEETPSIIDGIDFTLYDGTQESLETIIKEQVTYDTLKAFVCDTKTNEVK